MRAGEFDRAEPGLAWGSGEDEVEVQPPPGFLGGGGRGLRARWGRAAAGEARRNVGPRRYSDHGFVFAWVRPRRVTPRLDEPW